MSNNLKDLEDSQKTIEELNKTIQEQQKTIEEYQKIVHDNQKHLFEKYIHPLSIFVVTYFAKFYTNKVKWYNLKALADKAKLKNIKIEWLEEFESDKTIYQWEWGIANISLSHNTYVPICFPLGDEIHPSLKALEVTDVDIAIKQWDKLNAMHEVSPYSLLSYL